MIKEIVEKFDNSTYEKRFKRGEQGELDLINLLRRRGWYVEHLKKQHTGDHKGPRIYPPIINDQSKQEHEMVSPDMIIFRKKRIYYVEVKCADYCSTYGADQRYQVPISLNLYEDYCRVYDISPLDFYIFYIIEGNHPKLSDTPSGVFKASIGKIKKAYDHQYPNSSGKMMVYINFSCFKKFATLENLRYAERE